MPNRKIIKKILLALAVYLSLSAHLAAAQTSGGIAVIELYTSEGCSSCPPADLLLTKLTQNSRKENLPVYTLSFHVDYWDRLGWKDPYSQNQFTLRQRRYAQVHNSKSVYTPQFVVNGQTAFAGYRFDILEKAISSFLKSPAKAEINLEAAGNKKDIVIGYTITGHSPHDLLQIAIVEGGLKSPILRGENAGKTLEHENVVRLLKTVTAEKGAGHLKLILPPEANLANSSVIAYVQNSKTMVITGATGLSLKHLAEL